MSDRLLNPRQGYQLKRFGSFLDRIAKYNIEKEKGDYIYVLKCESFYKIGITSHLKSRLNNIQGGNPFEVIVIIAVRKKNAKDIESFLHKKYKHNNKTREWFSFSEIELNDIISHIHDQS